MFSHWRSPLFIRELSAFCSVCLSIARSAHSLFTLPSIRTTQPLFSTVAAHNFLVDVVTFDANNEEPLPTQALIDTGAADNTVSQLYAERLGHTIDLSQAEQFEGLGNLPVRSIGTIVIHFQLVGFDEEFTETFHVLSRECGGEHSTNRLILGTEFAKRLYFDGWRGWRGWVWMALHQ